MKPRDSRSSERARAIDKRALALESIAVLGKLAGLFEERRSQLAAVAGLSVGQWQVLEELQHEHFMPSMFAEQRDSSPAAVSKILRQLTDKGIITAHVSESDARKREYEVTDHGQKLLTLVRRERERAIDEVWLRLQADKLENFAEVGGAIATRLEIWANQNRPSGKK